jgi:hypothetical protein
VGLAIRTNVRIEELEGCMWSIGAEGVLDGFRECTFECEVETTGDGHEDAKAGEREREWENWWMGAGRPDFFETSKREENTGVISRVERRPNCQYFRS